MMNYCYLSCQNASNFFDAPLYYVMLRAACAVFKLGALKGRKDFYFLVFFVSPAVLILHGSGVRIELDISGQVIFIVAMVTAFFVLPAIYRLCFKSRAVIEK